MNTNLTSQLPLNIQVSDQFTFDNFVAGPNHAILTALDSLLKNSHDHYIFLWGPNESGKSHLLQAMCQQAELNKIHSAYLPLDNLQQETPALIENWETFDFVAIDNIQCIANNTDWQHAIFHLYNKLLSENKKILMSSNTAPRHLKIDLPDLKSRLTAGTCFHITPLNDDEKKIALKNRATQYGIKLNDEVITYIFNHTKRDFKELLSLLKKIDEMNLIQQRKVTIPLIKEAIKTL